MYCLQQQKSILKEFLNLGAKSTNCSHQQQGDTQISNRHFYMVTAKMGCSSTDQWQHAESKGGKFRWENENLC